MGVVRVCGRVRWKLLWWLLVVVMVVVVWSDQSPLFTVTIVASIVATTAFDFLLLLHGPSFHLCLP